MLGSRSGSLRAQLRAGTLLQCEQPLLLLRLYYIIRYMFRVWPDIKSGCFVGRRTHLKLLRIRACFVEKMNQPMVFSLIVIVLSIECAITIL